MRDRGAERGFPPRALNVDVNPLVVAGSFGKLVDALLRDFQPVADNDLLTRLVCKILYIAELCTRHTAPRSHC